MSTSSQVSLGALRLAAIEAADLENNVAVPTETWNQFISQGHKRLWDMLIAAYGNRYHVATTYQFTTNNNVNLYPLPDGSPNYIDSSGNIARKFYKLIGVDLQYSSSPSGWITLKNLEFIERNKFATPNTNTTWVGYTNLRYAMMDNSLYIAPYPSAGQLMQIWYAPAPNNLQYRLPGWCVAGSNVIGSFTDTTGLTTGMNITANYTQGVLPSGTTITAVGSTTVTVSNTALSSQNAFIFSMWSDATLIEGLSGWDQFVIIDAARKAMTKQEFDTSDMKEELNYMISEIQGMAEGRDEGQAFHVSDALGANMWAGDNDDGWGSGQGGWY